MEIVKINNDGKYMGLITEYGFTAWVKTAMVKSNIFNETREEVIDLVITKENSNKVIYRKHLGINKSICLNEERFISMVNIIEGILLVLQSDYDNYNKNKILDDILIYKKCKTILFEKLKKEYEEKKLNEEYDKYCLLINNKIEEINNKCESNNLLFKIIKNSMKERWHMQDTIVIFKILKDNNKVEKFLKNNQNDNIKYIEAIKTLTKDGYIKSKIIESEYSFDHKEYYNKIDNVDFNII